MNSINIDIYLHMQLVYNKKLYISSVPQKKQKNKKYILSQVISMERTRNTLNKIILTENRRFLPATIGPWLWKVCFHWRRRTASDTFGTGSHPLRLLSDLVCTSNFCSVDSIHIPFNKLRATDMDTLTTLSAYVLAPGDFHLKRQFPAPSLTALQSDNTLFKILWRLGCPKGWETRARGVGGGCGEKDVTPTNIHICSRFHIP